MNRFNRWILAILATIIAVAPTTTLVAQEREPQVVDMVKERVNVEYVPGVALVDTLELPSKYLATPMKVSVVHPVFMESKSYPVVYLLNGYGGDYRDYVNLAPRIKELADQYGMIIVCPDGRDSWYWDSPIDKGMQMESFIIKDLVPTIDTMYPTRKTAANRAIAGLSMGGHGAMWLGIRHPDLFGSIGSMSGGLNIEPFPGKWKIDKRLGDYKTNKEAWRNHTVINLVKTMNPGQNILIDCGTQDFFADVNNDVHKVLLEKGIPHDYISRPGNHSWPYWRNSLVYQLAFFNEAFRNSLK